MHLRYLTPAPALRPYVRCYYLLEGDFGGRTTDVFFADGCPELVFNVGVDFYRDGAREAWTKVIGQITRPLHVSAAGRGRSFGVWFRPHGLSAFTGVAASELTDTAVESGALFGTTFGEALGESLSQGADVGGGTDAMTLANQVDALLSAVLRRRTPVASAELVGFAVRCLTETKDARRIDNVAQACNMSTRQLQRLFREHVGLRPKQYQSIARFRETIDVLNDASRGSLTETAYAAGYFDQAHFIREFRRFAGVTPSRYHAADHPIGRHF